MKNPANTAPSSGPTVTLEAHVADLRAAVDTELAETAPRVRALRRYDEATVDIIVERYLAGASTLVIARELRMPVRTVNYQLRRRGIELRPPAVPWKHPAPEARTCPTCGEAFTPTGHQVANGGGKFCSCPCARAARRVAEPEERTCARKGCGETFTPMPSEAVRPGHGRFCSHRCRGLEFWRTGRVPLSFVRSLEERGLFGPRGRKRWLPQWAGPLGGRPRGYTDAQATHALELVSKGMSDTAAGRVAGMTRRQVQHARAKAAQNPS
jgi:hypothetical protein